MANRTYIPCVLLLLSASWLGQALGSPCRSGGSGCAAVDDEVAMLQLHSRTDKARAHAQSRQDVDNSFFPRQPLTVWGNVLGVQSVTVSGATQHVQAVPRSPPVMTSAALPANVENLNTQQPSLKDAAKPSTIHPGFTKVILADYPSTGSTWLKKLLGAVSQEKVSGNPSCAIYPEGKCMLNGTKGIYCDCDGFNPYQDAALVKTHFPSQEMLMHNDVNDWQYQRSMDFDKLVHLVRHPVSAVMSNVHRWPIPVIVQAANMKDWGKWWEKAKVEKGKPVMLLRYEDLCTNTSAKVHEVLQFIGGRFANIPLEHIETVLQTHPKLQSIHGLHDLHTTTQRSSQTEPVFRINELTDLMSKWGYHPWADEWPEKPALVDIGDRTLGERYLSELNPWSAEP